LFGQKRTPKIAIRFYSLHNKDPTKNGAIKLAPQHNIKTLLFSAVQKLSISFFDDIGNTITGSGTGFWLQTTRGKVCFVTNRHNVDSAMNKKLQKSYNLESITIWLRAYDLMASLPCGDFKQSTRQASELLIHWPSDNSDVVLIEFQRMHIPSEESHKLISIQEELIVSSRKPEIFDRLYFTGFPGKQRRDAAYDFPIVRSCSIASYPEIDYSQEDITIPSSQTCLVEGLSFAGSSGSPVMRINENRIELIGIMSGHFWEVDKPADHSGLSYFTKASSILNIIQNNNL
jgi:hypothetical protein